MRSLLIFAFCIFFTLANLLSQDTFSIVALDESTGEIGSAGASCVDNADQFGGVILISDIIPGRGAVNGQASVCIPHTNLNNAINQMSMGLSPDEILNWLYTNDACGFGTNEDRQYGIVDLDSMGNARSAAFTGSNTLDYAGHRIGSNYAIQGNILLGPEILDSMEYAFLNTTGSLAKKLMAALQGANVPGADSRCLDEGTSSKSAFLQVYNPDDTAGNPFLRINVQLTPDGVEPIDSLQVTFDEWCQSVAVEEHLVPNMKIYPNPVNDHLYIELNVQEFLQITFYKIDGELIYRQNLENIRTKIHRQNLPYQGLVVYDIKDEKGNIQQSGKLILK